MRAQVSGPFSDRAPRLIAAAGPGPGRSLLVAARPIPAGRLLVAALGYRRTTPVAARRRAYLVPV